MNPFYYQGDLVVVARASSYSVGDIAAYNLPDKDEVALHRIIGDSGEGFIFKGDNNQSMDPLRHRADELVGRAVLHIPQGGRWLETLTSPPGPGAAGIRPAGRRQRRSNHPPSAQTKESSRVPPHQHPPRSAPGPGRASVLAADFRRPWRRPRMMGVALGVLAWSGPTEEPSTSQVKSGTRMDFSYTAAVGQSPAYDGTTAHSPDPVFRKLTNTVDVHFTYHGEPGTVTVTADLSTPGGWHSTRPARRTRRLHGNDYEGSVRLDLTALEAKAQAASAVTGLPAGPLTIALTPQVTSATGTEFQPELKLNLTPLQLALTGGAGYPDRHEHHHHAAGNHGSAHDRVERGGHQRRDSPRRISRYCFSPPWPSASSS